VDPNYYNFTVGVSKNAISRYLQQLECDIKISVASINDKVTRISNVCVFVVVVFFFACVHY